MAHRVLIVDDSGFMRNIIKQIIAVDDELEVAGEAESAGHAMARGPVLRPDAALRLSRIGAIALRTYVAFFGECLDVARAQVSALDRERISA